MFLVCVGELAEIKQDLCNELPAIRREALKRIIALTTMGKDVGALFTDVLKCMQTDDISIKKLAYLYLVNYAKSQPELVILVINTFLKVPPTILTRHHLGRHHMEAWATLHACRTLKTRTRW